MNEMPLSGHVPYLIRNSRWEQREIFFQYESVHKEWIAFGVEDGSFYYEIENNHATASFGDLVICPPESIFRRVVISPVTLFVFHLGWKDDEGNELALTESGKIPVGKISFNNTDRLLANYSAMKQQSGLLERWNRVRINHYLHNIWMLYCEESGEVTRESGTPQPNDPLIEKAVLLIQKQAFQKMSMDAISTTLGISRVSLSKRFRNQMGTSPIKYLTDIRLKKAKMLLLETNLTLDEISECCGYQNGFYLSRVFMKNSNITPMQFRKENRL